MGWLTGCSAAIGTGILPGAGTTLDSTGLARNWQSRSGSKCKDDQ
ncbi:hypothetical protein ACPOL_5613 [Acidisarcina polymorpha]|uniref:Uncharacterized protein n=1 Tax=Acidisarcina polymorpha TaxID=2211140 RepID=A0A2Z5G6Z8_9BACT|nr:hypothetical protein ACPOL_5613 [Acidisarcina polymorpha]